MNYYDQLLEVQSRLEKQYPGKTIVLRASTLEPHIISDDPKVIAKYTEEIHAAGDVPIFIGGPHSEQKCFHMVC